MKETKFRSGLMSPQRPQPVVAGLRPGASGALTAVSLPRTVEGRGGWRPLCVLSSGQMLFGRGTSVLGGAESGETTLPFESNAPGTVRCALPAGPDSAIVMSDKGALVASYADGVWRSQPASRRYPSVRFKAVDAGNRTCVVGDRTLSKSFGGGTSLSASARAAVTGDFEDAYLNIVAGASASGLYAAPVLAWCRYLDARGEVVLTTPPVLVRGSTGFSPWAETTVTEGTLVKGYSVDVPVFGIEAVFEGTPCAEVAMAEVCVSPQLHPYSPGGATNVTVTRGDTSSLRVSLPGYGLSVTGDAPSGRRRLLDVLGTCPEAGTVAVRVAAPFSGQEKSVTIGCPGSGAVGDSNALDSALRTRRKCPTLAGVLLSTPHAVGARCVAADGTAVVWGGLRAIRFEGFPPTCFAATTGGTGKWRAMVTVTFGDRRKGVIFSGEFDGAAPQRLWPVLSYPSPDAREMRVGIFSGGVSRSATFALEPDASGCRAVYIEPGLKQIELPTVSSTQIVDMESADTDFPDMLAAAPASRPLDIAVTLRAKGEVQALSVLKTADSSWDYGRCRFVVAGSSGLYSLTVGSGLSSLMLRLLDGRSAAGADSLASADDGVYAALDGAVVHVGSKSRRASMLDVNPCTSLAWDCRRHELYLASSSAMAVYSPAHGGSYLRPDLDGASAMMCGSTPYLVREAWLARPDEDYGGNTVPVRLSFDFAPSGGAPARADAACAVCGGRLEEGAVRLSAVNGSGATEMIAGLSLSGDVRLPPVLRLFSRRHRCLRFELEGEAEPGFTFSHLSLYEQR